MTYDDLDRILGLAERAIGVAERVTTVLEPLLASPRRAVIAASPHASAPTVLALPATTRAPRKPRAKKATGAGATASGLRRAR